MRLSLTRSDEAEEITDERSINDGWSSYLSLEQLEVKAKSSSTSNKATSGSMNFDEARALDQSHIFWKPRSQSHFGPSSPHFYRYSPDLVATSTKTTLLTLTLHHCIRSLGTEDSTRSSSQVPIQQLLSRIFETPRESNVDKSS